MFSNLTGNLIHKMKNNKAFKNCLTLKAIKKLVGMIIFIFINRGGGGVN